MPVTRSTSWATAQAWAECCRPSVCRRMRSRSRGMLAMEKRMAQRLMEDQMSDGGKGSAPRKQRDDDAYGRNYEAIFGSGKKRGEVASTEVGVSPEHANVAVAGDLGDLQLAQC